jgi:hypothetical protein
MNTSTRNQVYSTTPEYDVMAEDWELPIALMGGEKAMKARGRIYLPQMPLETDAAYLQRLERSTLKNFFAWTVRNHVGRVFNKIIRLDNETPDNIHKYNANLDLMGNETNSFYKPVFQEALTHGISFVYVDFPRTLEEMSYAEEQDLSLRPYCIHVKAPQVIQAIPGWVNGRVVLERAHIYEVINKPVSKWGVEEIQQVRVLYPGYWELWREDDGGRSWHIVDGGETSLDYIPLFPFYGEKTGFFQGISPLQPLAYLNKAHWQSLSDQMNITHYARVPLLFGPGMTETDEGELKFSSDSVIIDPNPDAKLEYVEHSGAAIEAGMVEVKDLEERMIIEGLTMLAEGTSFDTATGKSLDISDRNSALQDMAMRLQEFVTRVNQCMCDWDGIDRAGEAIVNTDFGLHLKDGSELNIILKARQNRSISLETFWQEFQRRQLLAKDFDPEKEKKLLEEERETAMESMPYQNEDGKQVVGDDKEDDLDTGKPRVE